MVVLGFAAGRVVINPVIDRIVFSAVAVHQVDDADASYQTAHCTALLFPDRLDQSGIALVWHAVVDDQERILGIVDQLFDQIPHLPRRYPALFQEVTHHVVTDAVQMLRQVKAGVVDRRTDQVFDVTLFRDHAR